MKICMKRLFALVLCAVILFALLPAIASSAAEENDPDIGDQSMTVEDDLHKKQSHEEDQNTSKTKVTKGKETHSDEPLSVGENTFMISEADEAVYRPFTPSVTTSYIFYSISDYDTRGELYDADYNSLTWGEDNDHDLNFRFRASLKAGETYYLCVSCPWAHETGAVTVCIEQQPANKCGEQLTWSFNSGNGKLTISGSGEMWDFFSGSAPWYSVHDQIKSVSLPNGLTYIGDHAFRSCHYMQSISIPNSVTYFGQYALAYCTSMEQITLPVDLDAIGYAALAGCTSLTSIELPDGMEYLWYYAFYYCTSLIEVTIPISLHHIYYGAFDSCSAITDVYFRGTFDQSKNISISSRNDCLTDAEWHYLGIPCPHKNTYEGLDDDNYSYTDIGDDLWHRVNYTLTPYTYCQDCEKIIERGASTPASYFDYHCYDSGTCSECGHRNNCQHLHRESMYEWEDVVYTDFGSNSEHDATGTYTYYEYCLDCGTCVLEETRTDTIREAHSYDSDGKCWYCEHVNSCTHPNGFMTEEILDKPDYTDYNDQYHLVDVTRGEVPYCPLCGQHFYSEYEWEDASYLEEHVYDACGFCRYCAHQNGSTFVEGVIEWNPNDVQYKGTTPYVVANGSAQTPRFTVRNQANGNAISSAYYDYEYRENRNAGTGYVIVTFKNGYTGTCRGFFKIYLPATTATSVENVNNGIRITWSPVTDAAGYVIYRRAWSSTTNGWTDFVRWNNTTALEWIDGSDASHKVYAGTRYQYGIKAYFEKRTDPITGALIGGNVGDNYNLGMVGPLKTTVRITTRTLESVTAGKRQMLIKWGASSVFTGYQVQYATDSAFTKNVNTVKITNPKTSQCVAKNLTSGKTYYVRVRSYHEFNGMTYFGGWSNVKSCKVK